MNFLIDGLFQNLEPSSQFAKIPGPEKERWYTYQDVLDVSARLANVLTSRGVQPGDRVAVQVPKSIEALMLYLGTIRAGAVFLPLNTAYTPSEVEFFLTDAEPSIFVCDPHMKNDYIGLAENLGVTLDTLGVWQNPEESAGTLADDGLQASTHFQNVARKAEDLAAILYTSGTTGRSKGAMLTHENLLSNTKTLVDYWEFTEQDILLHALPIFHTHGLFVATNVVIASGASMLFFGAFDKDAILENLPRVTSLMGVPTFYTRLLNDDRLNRALVKNMRLFISGSAPLLAETHNQFGERTGHRILERYGMTETNMNTSNPYRGERIAGTVGFPLPGVEVRVTDQKTGAVLGCDKVGMVEVKGPNVFSGYWKLPEKTKEEFRSDGFFITGDLGKIDADGYLQIVGRSKDLIISGGYNIYPKEIELVLDDCENVEESAVIGVPHPDFGEAVLGIVVSKPGTDQSEETILKSIEEKLARFKQPKRLIFVDGLPRNTMGKVQKNLLREQFKAALDKS
ncbi:MAG: malonyl-CoA synthase [Pseudomonadota bacterium]